mgnify:CR=1 FL=1
MALSYGNASHAIILQPDRTIQIDKVGLRGNLAKQAMIQGIAFMSHQFGSFTGAFGGGYLFDLLGNYTLAWQLGVGLGLIAGAMQLTFALTRPPAPRPA